MATFTPRFGVFPLDHTVYSFLFIEVRFLIIIISYKTIIVVLCSLKARVIYRQSEPAVTNQLVIFHLRCRIIMFTMCPTGVRFTTEIVVQCCVWSIVYSLPPDVYCRKRSWNEVECGSYQQVQLNAHSSTERTLNTDLTREIDSTAHCHSTPQSELERLEKTSHSSILAWGLMINCFITF